MEGNGLISSGVFDKDGKVVVCGSMLWLSFKTGPKSVRVQRIECGYPTFQQPFNIV